MVFKGVWNLAQGTKYSQTDTWAQYWIGKTFPGCTKRWRCCIKTIKLPRNCYPIPCWLWHSHKRGGKACNHNHIFSYLIKVWKLEWLGVKVNQMLSVWIYFRIQIYLDMDRNLSIWLISISVSISIKSMDMDMDKQISNPYSNIQFYL